MTEQQQQQKKKSDSFTILKSDVGVEGGRYHSSNGPQAAARKAATQIFRNSQKAQEQGTVRLAIKKTTRGSDGLTFVYNASRVELQEPKERVINGEKIVNRYDIAVKPVKQTK